MNELVCLMSSVDEKVHECIEQYIQLHKEGMLSSMDALLEIDKILLISRTENREQLLYKYREML